MGQRALEYLDVPKAVWIKSDRDHEYEMRIYTNMEIMGPRPFDMLKCLNWARGHLMSLTSYAMGLRPSDMFDMFDKDQNWAWGRLTCTRKYRMGLRPFVYEIYGFDVLNMNLIRITSLLWYYSLGFRSLFVYMYVGEQQDA